MARNQRMDILPLWSELCFSLHTEYLRLLQEKLIKDAKKDDEIGGIFINDNGNLQLNDKSGSFLSIYEFSTAKVFYSKKTNNNFNAIISVPNAGDGGDGNVVVTENYSMHY